MQRPPRCGLCSMLAVTGAGPLLWHVPHSPLSFLTLTSRGIVATR